MPGMAGLAPAMLKISVSPYLLFLTGEELVESTVLQVFFPGYTGKGCFLDSLTRVPCDE